MGENLLPKKLLLLSFIVSLLLFPSGSQAIVVVINPTDDTHVNEFNPIDTYGSSPDLCVGFQDGVDFDLRCRTFLKFDLSAIPSNAVIVSALLEMDIFEYSSTMSPTDVDVHFVFPVAWNEATLSWNLPPSSKDDYIPSPGGTQTINSPGLYQWNVTAHIMAAFYSNLPYHALLKVANDQWISGQSDLVKFRAKESGSPPNLIVEYSLPVIPYDTPELEGSVKIIKITGPLEPYKDTTGLIYVDGSDDYGPHRETIYDLTGGPTDYYLDGRIQITYTGTLFGPNDIRFSPDNGIEPETISNYEYDSLNRLCRVTSNPAGSADQSPTELKLSYDIPGNVKSAQVTHENGSNTSWMLDYDSEGNIFKKIYEKKDTTQVPPVYSGIVGYFLANVNQLLYKTKPGALPEATLYTYDDADRLTNIADVLGSYLREYLYNPNGLLDEYTNHQNSDYNSAINYSYDSLNRLCNISSQTNVPLPETTFLGRLALNYNENGTLGEVGYATDEDTALPVQPIYYSNYTYDGLDRRIRSEYISHDPEIPGIIVVMDPDAPELDYTTTHYIYDNFGRLTWTVDSNGYVTRTIYNQGPGLEEKKMVQIHMEEPAEIYLTTFEHNDAGEILRTTDLAGNFTQYDNDAHGNPLGSYVLGGGGGGGSLSGASGQVFQMSAYDEFKTPLPDDILLRYEFDQYGDFGVVIQEKDFSLNGGDVSADAAKKKTKKKVSKNKKKTKKKSASEKQKGCTETVIGDHNGDCKTNLLDFAIFCNHWLTDKSK